jgi:hypothetical protein
MVTVAHSSQGTDGPYVGHPITHSDGLAGIAGTAAVPPRSPAIVYFTATMQQRGDPNL